MSSQFRDMEPRIWSGAQETIVIPNEVRDLVLHGCPGFGVCPQRPLVGRSSNNWFWVGHRFCDAVPCAKMLGFSP